LTWHRQTNTLSRIDGSRTNADGLNSLVTALQAAAPTLASAVVTVTRVDQGYTGADG
jgi:hypothetical protein